MAEEILVSITSEDVLSLKQSCQVIIDAYKRYAGSILVDDENGSYPLILEQVKGLRIDAESGRGSLDSFDQLSLDDIDRPSEKLGDLNSFGDLDKISGNYSISQSIYDEAKTEVKDIFDGLKHREVPVVEESLGSNFQKNNITNKEYPHSKKKETPSIPRGESINDGETKDLSKKVVDSNLSESQTISSAQSVQSRHKSTSKGKYKNTLIEECIPCFGRLTTPDGLNPSVELLGVLEDLLDRYKGIVEKLKSLFTNTDIVGDLCSLLGFLEFHCLPDLYGIIALLTALMRKYADIIPNLDGAFMQFIGPFFGPLLSGVNELLDRYIQLIMKPVDCVLNSLDTQLAKLDVVRSIDQAEVQEVSFHRKREGYLRRKIEKLEERKSFLKSLDADPDGVPPQKIGGYKGLGTIDVTERINSKKPKAQSINQEIAIIDQDLADLGQKYNAEYGPNGENNIQIMLKKSQEKRPNIVGNARGSLRDARQGLSSSLYELRNQILNGRQMINDTLRIMREELQRLILGRAATSEEMLEGIRNIQKLARLIGIVKTLGKLAKIKKRCENSNGDPSVALGSFLTASKGTKQNNNNYNVYIGNNNDGEKSLLIASSDAILELADPETDEITQLDNLEEIDKLNRDGLPKDLGNITDKKITATVPSLGAEAPIAIIALDLCSKSSSTNTDIDAIQQWAQNAGLNV